MLYIVSRMKFQAVLDSLENYGYETLTSIYHCVITCGHQLGSCDLSIVLISCRNY